MNKKTPPRWAKSKWNALYPALTPDQKAVLDLFVLIRNKIGKGEILVLTWLTDDTATGTRFKALKKYLVDTDPNEIRSAQCGRDKFMANLKDLNQKIDRQEFYKKQDASPTPERNTYNPSLRVGLPIHRKIGHT